jgi:thioredoxin reductase/bacterioferritin-associated ferredoxin
MNPLEETVQIEVAVVGAGPAGLSAALTAARAGAQVMLIDNYRQPGGQYYRQLAPEFRTTQTAGHQQEGRVLWQQVTAAGVELLTETTVWGAFEDNRLALYGAGAPAYIQARTIILATGAYERVATFPGWTLPGVVTSGAVQVLLKEQRIFPGRRILLAGTGPLQLVVAAGLVQTGAEVIAVLDGTPFMRRTLHRPLHHALDLWGQWSRLAEGLSSWLTLRKAGVTFYAGWGVVAAHGQEELTGVTIAQLDREWRPIPGTSRTLTCDTLCCNYGFTPATELARLLGVRCEWRSEQGGVVPDRNNYMQSDVPGVFVVGDGAGIGGAGLALVEGQIAGLVATAEVNGNGSDWRKSAQVADGMKRLLPALHREQRFQRLYGGLFTPGPGLDEMAEPDTVICRCEGVTRAGIGEAVRQGADTLDAVKALTRCGMGNCQGRVCGPSVTAALAQEVGQLRAEIGQFRARPPVFPVPLSAFKPTVSDLAES